MSDKTQVKGKGVAINTFIIYAQKFSSAALSLITTPLILNQLGIEDYGLFSLSIGFVAVLSFLNWSLSASTQRAVGVAIGANAKDDLPNIFSTAFFIHFVFACIILSIILLLTFFWGEQLLNVPVSKLHLVAPVLFLVGIISFCSIISVPFTGILRANENFKVIAVFGVSESILKLLAASLLLIFPYNRLIYYGIFLAVIAIIMFAVNFVYCSKNYSYVIFKWKFISRKLIKEMLFFISWSFIGALAVMSRNQGVSVIINIFFGVIKNAAYGVSMQINAALAILSQGVQGSISPKIIKSAGAGNIPNMIYLMRSMSKFSIFSVSIIGIPFFFNVETILVFWLRTIPEDTIAFVKLAIISSQIMLLSSGIQTVFDAIGKVKMYNLWVSIILLFNLPISFLCFKYGHFPSFSIVFVGILLEVVSLAVRIIILRKYVSFSVRTFIYETIFQIILPLMLIGLLLFGLQFVIVNKFIYLIASFLFSLIFYPIIVYRFSLDNGQKEIFKGLLPQKFRILIFK